uniref:Uncharacterized protein n=1 Tax=Rhizophora mucronata TaxID=61149 RepID=A0A2P2NVY4_RHIMU
MGETQIAILKHKLFLPGHCLDNNLISSTTRMKQRPIKKVITSQENRETDAQKL